MIPSQTGAGVGYFMDQDKRDIEIGWCLASIMGIYSNNSRSTV